jgi:alanine dehydrogenase
MAAWPLYAEQHLNAFALAAAMGAPVAVKVDRARGNFAGVAEVERAVRELMGGGEVGRRVRDKAAEMKAACRNAVGDGGSSTATLRRLSRDIVSKCARF